jgi:hypothetical protein
VSHPPAPAPARPARQRTIGRRLLLLGQHILHHDNILITVIAVAMTLSAVAVYQATRAADEASDLLDQSRIVSAESSRQVGYLQTLVDHDLDVLRTYCTAEVQRDVARVSFLSYDPDLSALVTANLTLDGLRPLLLGDREADCAADAGRDYLMQRAAERLDNWQSGSDASNASGAELEAQAAIYHRDEAFLMTAGLLFAVVVAAIIAIDQLGSRRARPGKMLSRTAHRWQYGMLVLGALALAAGLVLLVLFAVDMLLVVAIVVALAIAVIAEAVWLRRRRGSFAATAVDPGRHRRARPQWWAEMIGAVALIAFTASAVGLSLVSIQEREANARANRESSFALDLQRVGQQQALRALASLSFIAQMDAEEVTAQQLSSGDATVGIPSSVEDPASIEALRDVVDQRLQAADQDLRDQVASSSEAGAAADCDESAAGEAPLPSTLLEDLGSDPDSVLWYVLDQQRPSRACDVMAALSRQEARIWSTHGSTFTVALVVLGLAAFLLALASSSERTSRSSRTLLIIGAAGTGLGVALALLPLPALLGGTDVPRGVAAQRFGDELAASKSDSCAGTEGLNDAIDSYGGYSEAFVLRASAVDCEATVHDWPAISSERTVDAVPRMIADLERALALGPATPALEGNLGWYGILHGIQSEGVSSVRRGLEHTESALAALEADPQTMGDTVHIFRFNQALALAALGEHDAALRTYQRSARCLDPTAGCPGGGLSDRDVEDDTRLGALADLELLPAGGATDDYRTAILGAPATRGPGPVLGDATFDVFPQELQIAQVEGYGPQDARVVWYYRPDDTLTWALLSVPSKITMHGGGALDTPIRAGALLKTGDYRADVYVDGHRIAFETSYESDDSLVRYESRRLGVSVVVPADWFVWTDDGVEWQLGPDEDTGIIVRRVEGMSPGFDVGEVGDYLDAQLGAWWATSADSDLTTAASPWLLGLPDVVVKEGDQDGDGYADVVEGAGLSPFAKSWRCGGSVFSIRAASTEDSPSAWDLYDSVVLEREADTLPEQDPVLQADGVSLEVPFWWDAAIRPPGSTGDLFSAQDCDGGANMTLTTEDVDGDLAAYVDDRLALYGDGAYAPGFTLESRSSIAVPGADAAEMLVYTWLPEGYTEPLRDWDIYAMRGTTVAYADITTSAADLDYYRDALDIILPSMAMTDP